MQELSTTAREHHLRQTAIAIEAPRDESEDVGQICIFADVEGGAVLVLSDGGA
jgi:hypothetical protein